MSDALHTEPLTCPLCGYDLRGLPENRCPECGHAFDPDELRREKAERPWFFEHARRRLIRAFVLTSLATLWPLWFWKKVSAADEIVPRRLSAWAVGLTIVAVLTIAMALTLSTIWTFLEARFGLQTTYSFSRFGTWIPSTSGINRARLIFYYADLELNLGMGLAILLWPPFVMLASGCFGRTLRKASIRSGHLARVALYGWPTLLLPCIAFASASMFLALNSTRPYFWPDLLQGWLGEGYDPRPSLSRASIFCRVAPLAVFPLATAAFLSTIHLIAAHARYLRLPHAIGQAILVQLVAWLAILLIVQTLS